MTLNEWRVGSLCSCIVFCLKILNVHSEINWFLGKYVKLFSNCSRNYNYDFDENPYFLRLKRSKGTSMWRECARYRKNGGGRRVHSKILTLASFVSALYVLSLVKEISSKPHPQMVYNYPPVKSIKICADRLLHGIQMFCRSPEAFHHWMQASLNHPKTPHMQKRSRSQVQDLRALAEEVQSGRQRAMSQSK